MTNPKPATPTNPKMHPQHDRLLRLPQVEQIAGIRRTKIYALIDKDRFPRQVKIGKASFWSERAVLKWVADLVEGQNGEAA